MSTFDIAGITFVYGTNAVGFTPQGISGSKGVVRMIRERELSALRVLDICCGIGLIGLTVLKRLGRSIVRELTVSDINIFNLTAVHETLEYNAALELGPVEVVLSDGLKSVPLGPLDSPPFDLIVSNPPHCEPPPGQRMDTPSWLGTCDPDWRFHREFYAVCHRFLPVGGEVWFIENGNTGIEPVALAAIQANPHLEYLGTPNDPEFEPTDPVYFWMRTRRVR